RRTAVNQSWTVPVRSCNDISRKTAGTPLGAVGRGLAAGAVGTLAMDLLLYARYRRGGGKQHLFAWEFSSGLSSWDEAPVPGQVGKRLFEGLFQKKLPPQWAELVSNITHWAYGMLNGALYGIAAESLGQPRTWYGLPFGAGGVLGAEDAAPQQRGQGVGVDQVRPTLTPTSAASTAAGP